MISEETKNKIHEGWTTAKPILKMLGRSFLEGAVLGLIGGLAVIGGTVLIDESLGGPQLRAERQYCHGYIKGVQDTMASSQEKIVQS